MWTVYKLNLANGETYFGISKDVRKRLYDHKSRGGKSDHPYLSFRIVLTDLDEETAREVEDELIQTLPCINKERSGFISKDENYAHNQYLRNKTRHNEQSRNWHNAHRDEHNEANRVYRYEHRDERLAYDRSRYEEEKAIARANGLTVTKFRALPKEQRDALRQEYRENQ